MCSTATFALLIPANLLPLMRVSIHHWAIIALLGQLADSIATKASDSRNGRSERGH
jgi:hypothetical protein